MNSLTYFKFLECLGFANHYQAPRTEDRPADEWAPLELMPEGYGRALLKEIELGSVHPIVISLDFIKKHQLVGETYTEKFTHYLGKKDVPFELPLPFDSIWLEFLPEHGSMKPILGASLPQWGRDKTPQVFGYLVQKIGLEKGPAYSITAFVIVGSENNIDEVCTVSDILLRDEYQKMAMGGSGHITMYGLVWHRQLFDILNLMCQEKQVGLDKTKTQVRAGKGKERRLVKVKNIVYVVPSTERSDFNQKNGTNIDWSHRWEVRGHWRRVAHIGKDPEGNYCIPGFTWVLPSIKGPDTSPLIRKTRYALPSKVSEVSVPTERQGP